MTIRWICFYKAIAVAIFGASSLLGSLGVASAAPVEFVEGSGRVTVAIDGMPVAVYCYGDGKVRRPFFAHVRTPSGIQVTRHHPPIAGQDPTDHDTFHPGIWLSFGDLSGSDFWRGTAEVRSAGLVEKPRSGDEGSFVARNEYLDQSDPAKVLCEEIARYTVVPRTDGFLLICDSTFSSDHKFAFGDQEEMGLGVRLATPIRVEKTGEEHVPPGNGRILDSEGRVNGDQIWGNSAEWCDYSGAIAGQHVGVAIFCHPANFRPSWFHARDYGLVAANAFGREAFSKGEKSSVVVKPGEELRLRYGVFVHSDPEGNSPDLQSEFDEYVRLSGK
jgi:hypothetical protein